MKLPTINFGNIKNTLFARRSVHTYRNPRRDWVILLRTFAFVFIGLLVVWAVVFYGIVQGTLFAPSPTDGDVPAIESINRDSIDSTSALYTSKVQKLDVIEHSTSTMLIDPSL